MGVGGRSAGSPTPLPHPFAGVGMPTDERNRSPGLLNYGAPPAPGADPLIA